ncbi:MAG TPA: phosphotransferase [Chthoniobacteraceae bacterium]|jgi:aminoglycoside/choline kinase family phosphotransferase|nr:Aminoglycoside phosphotransferase [Chthoniobacter sp.]HEV7866162.1 phosphotransferase [Chthoniobacteraceae bacterium]
MLPSTAAASAVAVVPIEKGGSGRKFWRLTAGGESLILVRYGEDRPENAQYVAIARFLLGVGVRVPAIHFHDEVEGLILMEDAGETDLWSYRDDLWRVRRALYQRTLDEALTLHTRAHLAGEVPELKMQPVFDAPLYCWEQDYFIEHCLGRHFGLSAVQIADACDRPRLQAIADELADLPRCLVHRDFQSQNVIVRNGEVCLIDFQGLRPGIAHYDLASLLYDPYVTLTSAEREELLSHYISGLRGPGQHETADFRAVYQLCAMQRLMQALGAYGKLGHGDGRTQFLGYIPTALRSLRKVVAGIDGLEKLSDLLRRLPPV